MTAVPTIPGLSAADSAAYTAALATGCDVRIQILTLTLSHALVAAVEPLALDGQINVVDADVDRTLQVGFLDPDRALRVDGTTPESGVGGLDRLIQVRTAVHTPALGRWISAPAGTFRPSAIGRDGDTVTIEAQSKASMFLRGVDAYTIPKGTPVIHAIRRILAGGGETRFRFPKTARAKLPAAVAVGGPDDNRQEWKVATRLARSIDLRLFYDLRGWACLAPLPGTRAWSLVEAGETANTLSRVRTNTDLTTIRNRVVVTGHTKPTKKAKGHPAAKSRLVKGLALPPYSHPHSPNQLLVNGHAWSNTAFFDQPNLHTKASCDNYAKARLNELLLEQTDVATSTFPVWHLKRNDVLRLYPAVGTFFDFRFKEGSIPLGPASDGMTIGYRQRVRAPSAGRLRRR